MFTIVQFKNTNEVEGVPSTWLIKGPTETVCLFPSCQSTALETLLIEHDMPNKGWKKYPVTILCTCSSYDSMVVKRSRARSETEISDSEVETPKTKKRKRHPTVESDDDLGTDENLSPPPSPPSGFDRFL